MVRVEEDRQPTQEGLVDLLEISPVLHPPIGSLIVLEEAERRVR